MTSRSKKTEREAPQDHFRLDLENFVPYRISILATLIRRAISEIYRDDPGLTEPGWKVLTTIAHKGPLPSGDIGLHMTLDRMAISRALAELIKLKLVARMPFERDQRMTEVKLSSHGERVFGALARQAAAIEEAILKPLSSAEVLDFLQLINKIETNFRTYGNPRRPTLIDTATAISKGQATREKPRMQGRASRNRTSTRQAER